MKNIVYLNDKEFTLIRDKIYKYKFNSLDKGNIINIKEFNNEINNILKKLKINRGIMGEEVIIYLNDIITPINEAFYKDIFSELGFRNCEIRSIKMFLEEKNTFYLILNEYSSFLYHDNNYYELPSLDVFNNLKFKNPIKIFGNNQNIQKIKNLIKEKNDIKVYMFYPPDRYIENIIKNVN